MKSAAKRILVHFEVKNNSFLGTKTRETLITEMVKQQDKTWFI